MTEINFENSNKGLCVVCNKKMSKSDIWICLNCFNPCKLVQHRILDTKDTKNIKDAKDDEMLLDMKSECCLSDVRFVGRITCSESCHKDFVIACEEKFGKVKKIIDETTDIAYKVPTRDIIEKGVAWQDLPKYPLWDDD